MNLVIIGVQASGKMIILQMKLPTNYPKDRGT